MMKRTIFKGCNDSDEIVVRLPVMFFGFSLSRLLPDDLHGLLVLLRNSPYLLTCSTDVKDNDVSTVHVYNQSTCVLI
jgi:hypothetical protein